MCAHESRAVKHLEKLQIRIKLFEVPTTFSGQHQGDRKTPGYKIWVNIFFHLVNGLVFLASSLAVLIDFSARAALQS